MKTPHKSRTKPDIDQAIPLAPILLRAEALLVANPGELNGQHLRRLLRKAAAQPDESGTMTDDEFTENISTDLAVFTILNTYLKTAMPEELLESIVKP